MARINSKKAALIVTHPGDETLWAGGSILSHPSWDWFVVCLCRGGQPDDVRKYNEALQNLGVQGVIGDLDGGVDQLPSMEEELEKKIIDLLPASYFDLIISHSPSGEYTSNTWHQDTGKAVIKLWHSGKISAAEFWAFAYEDGEGNYLPKAIETAGIFRVLSRRILRRKMSIIAETYGIDQSYLEAENTPLAESFFPYTSSFEARKLLR